MIPWSLLDTAQIPGGGELRLMRRGAEFSIRLGRDELMNSRLSATEQALATIACEKIRTRKRPIGRPSVLIGGLGMGFTLRAALTVLGPQARITVAELVPAVVAWARGPMAKLSGDSLNDPRVRLHQGDVGDLIKSGRSDYDAILLDVDNGPHGMTRKANDGLYDLKGLRAAYTALRPARRTRGMVVGAGCKIHGAAAQDRIWRDRESRARQGPARRRAAFHLDRDKGRLGPPLPSQIATEALSDGLRAPPENILWTQRFLP